MPIGATTTNELPSGAQPTRLVAGVSLKMYLGAKATRAWLVSVAGLAPLPSGVELFVLPAFPYLSDAQEALAGTGIAHGAQDVWYEASGPFTGEISPPMLSELGCTYVVVGHLERRDLFGEDDDTVARKARAAMKYGLVPVVCVGEPAVMPIRQARQFVIKQLVSSLKGVPDAPIIVAYEPSFAIGADQPAPADHVVRVTTAFREALSSRTAEIGVLYGGTAGPGTLRALQEQCTALPVDGLFLGRRAHDVAQLAQVLSEMAAVIRRQTDRALPDSRAGQLGRAERRSARG